MEGCAAADLSEYAVKLLFKIGKKKSQLNTKCVFGKRMLHAGQSSEMAKCSAVKSQ